MLTLKSRKTIGALVGLCLLGLGGASLSFCPPFVEKKVDQSIPKTIHKMNPKGAKKKSGKEQGKSPHDIKGKQAGKRSSKVDTHSLVPGRNHNYQALSYAYSAKWVNEVLSGKTVITGKKLVFLTFDDGPNNEITPKLLDKLKKEKVPATFFTVGKAISSTTKGVLKREIAEGHAVALHSFSHDYHKLYPNRQANQEMILSEVKENLSALKEQLGKKFHTSVFRYPGGHMSWHGLAATDQALNAMGIEWMDWNAANGDALPASQAPKTRQEMLAFHEKSLNFFPDTGIRVILMHDAHGKKLTLEAVDGVIAYYRQKGYRFAVFY